MTRPVLCVPATRVGINVTTVRSASIDRLVWCPAAAGVTKVEPRRGQVDRRPAARGRFSTLHRAVDRDGNPAWVRRSAPCLTESYAVAHSAVLDLAIGATVPALRSIDGDGIWIERVPLVPSGEPLGRGVDCYVAAAVMTPLRDGVIVGSGEPHVQHDGSIVIEDVLVAARLEPDERRLLRNVVSGLVDADPGAVVAGVAELCRARPPGLAGAARRSTIALRADWSPFALGLALHQTAVAAMRAGPRSEPLVLLADELLHRLDLAHHHRTALPSLGTPRSVRDLVFGTVSSR
jgi:hypothetical protein